MPSQKLPAPGLLRRLNSTCAGLTGWRRFVLAAGAGAACYPAFAPFNLWPVLFFTFPVLVWLLDGAADGGPGAPSAQTPASRLKLRRGFVTGWSFGFGYFLLSLHWIAFPFLVDAARFGWALPFAVSLMPAGLALFWGAACALAVRFWPNGLARIFWLAVLLALAEWLRGHVLTGFPWNLPGYGVSGLSGFAQLASLTGIYGLSLLVLIAAAVPAGLWPHAGRARAMPAGVGLVMAVAALGWGWGQWRLASAPSQDGTGIAVRIVQPNIPQKQKWLRANANAIFNRIVKLTTGTSAAAPEGLTGIALVIWPESTLPFLVAQNPGVLKVLGAMLPEGTTLVMGATRRAGSAQLKPQERTYYNSVLAINSKGQVTATYDKRTLVPFGEYLPLAGLLKPLGIQRLVALPGGFATGSGPKLLHLAGLPGFVPLICYEAIFPRPGALGARRPAFLLNVTNDAWFGPLSGPAQHLSQTAMRAIEEGLPVLRAANTGISAVIGPYGRITRRLGLATTGIIDARLPGPLPATLYARFGDRIFMLLAALTLIISGFVHRSSA